MKEGTPVYVGFDVGLSAAFAFIYGDDSDPQVQLYTMPILQVGKRRELDLQAIRMSVQARTFGMRLRGVAIEKAQPNPKDGKVGAFRYGDSFGQLKGLMAGLSIPFELVTPQAWKKRMMPGMPKDKQASIYVCKQLFPRAAELFVLKKDHNKADALLIAEDCRRRALGVIVVEKRRRIRVRG